jgi:hypothetical protein
MGQHAMYANMVGVQILAMIVIIQMQNVLNQKIVADALQNVIVHQMKAILADGVVLFHKLINIVSFSE